MSNTSSFQDRRLILADVDEESGSGIPAPNLYYPAFAMPAEQPTATAGPNCPECKNNGKFREGGGGGISTRKKLLFLLLVASLSLLR